MINGSEKITKNEVKSLDSRILFCLVENPNEDYFYFCVKIYFNYLHGGKMYNGGRHEFIADNKQELIDDIIEFMTDDDKCFKIV